MTELQEVAKFAQVLHKIDPHSQLLRTWQLQGGVSAQVTALEIARPDSQTQKMVVRQHGSVDLQHNPQIALTEFKLLQFLQSVGMATPKPYFLDQSSEIFATPYLVIEYIEGTTAYTPAQSADLIPQLATHLSKIHHIPYSHLNVPFLPFQAHICTTNLSTRPSQIDESLNEGAIRDTLEAAWPFPQQNASVLLHGDFWPGNILWHDGHLAAILDWEDAKIGDPLADLANSRLEILWTFGADAMQNFTAHYQALTPIDYTNLPYWDLYAALRPVFKLATWAADASIEQRMRASHHWFITQAWDKLAHAARSS